MLAELEKVVEYNGDVDLRDVVLADATSIVVSVVAVSSLVDADELELLRPVDVDDAETDDDCVFTLIVMLSDEHPKLASIIKAG